MKTKISKILGVGLTIIMLASMMIFAAPASAGTLAWGASSGPDQTWTTAYENTVVVGNDVIDVAANGNSVYAATNNATKPLYKSTDGGAKWSSLATSQYGDGSLTLGSINASVKAIAVAPDNADMVVALLSTNNVTYSMDGGASWTDLGIPDAGDAATINAIDISPGATKIIAAGGTLTGAARLYTIKLSMAETWVPRYTGASGIAAAQAGIFAVKFSPNYTTDKAIAVISGTTTKATLQLFRYEVGDYDWNGDIDYLPSIGDGSWVGGIDLTSGNISGGILTADIALPSTYLANDEGERLAFVALAAGGSANDGVIRVTDVVVKAAETWSGGDEGACGSVAYNEAGTLLAGSYNENKVYQFLTPTATTPKASRTNTLKQPGGVDKTVVTLSGDTVVAGTSGDESALALSTNDGYSFNDVALVDMQQAISPPMPAPYDDFAVNADGSKVYITQHDTSEGAGAYDTSVWVKTKILGVTRFVRVLSLKNSDSTVAGAYAFLVRIAPEDDSVVYISAKDTTNMWVSKNSGLESWKSIPNSKIAGSIQDFAVADADTVYALDDTTGQGVSKTTNAGASWGETKEPTDKTVLDSYMLYLAPGGDIYYGDSAGYICYSRDGGATFTRGSDYGTTGTGYGPQITADPDYETNGLIYVGIGTEVKRGKYAGSAKTIHNSLPLPVRGIAAVGEGLYVISANSTQNSALYLSLKAQTAADTNKAEWTNVLSNTAPGSTGASIEWYISTPSTLKVSSSGGSPQLYSIDSRTRHLDTYTDKASMSGPTLVSPEDGATVSINTASGKAYDITYIFNRYSSSYVKDAELQISADADFNAIVHTGIYGTSTSVLAGATDITTDTVAKVIGPFANDGDGLVEYLPGATYYWRVRTTTPLNTVWSETRSFTVDSLEDPFAVAGPVVGASDVSILPTLTWAKYDGAIHYELSLSEDPSFAIPEWSHNVDNAFYVLDAATETLDYSTSYYWRVRGVTGETYTEGKTIVVPAGPWITGVFTTMAEPVEATPGVGVPVQPEPPQIIEIEKPILIP
ncbi:WD40/YVTN/BNR-like repeat-containing protein, partial [Chloroflexota bacterium]